MAHDHGEHSAPAAQRAHAHGHAHGGARTGRAFVISVTLNALFVVIELGAGLVSHSVALVADAAHNFSDVLGLGLAWAAAYLATRKPSSRRTYGLRRSTILASVANALLLLVGVGAVSWEAIGRLREGSGSVEGSVVVAVAAAGVVVNVASALPFLSERKTDINVRGAFLHLMADAAVSLGVVIAGVLMLVTHWRWLDAAVSLLVSGVIVASTWSLLRDSTNLALDAVPDNIDPDEVREFLCGLAGVEEVHDLHIWAMSTTETALTVHLVARGAECPPHFLRDVTATLDRRFGVHHSTIQLEPPDAPDPCVHAPDDVV